MKKITLILIGLLIIASLVITFLVLHNRTEKIEYRDEIETIKGKYTDELGHQVSFTQAVQTRLSEMEAVSKRDSSELNNYQIRLAWAYKEISALNGKIKNLSGFTIVGTEVSGEFTVPLKDTTVKEKDYKIAFYNNDYLDEMIIIPESLDSVNVQYLHSDTLLLADYWVRKPNKKGKQVFFLWRWLRPWEVHLQAKTMDPNSEVTLLDKVVTKK